MARAVRWGSVERGRARGEEWVLADIYAGKLSGLEHKLICCFKLAAEWLGV